MLWCIAMADEDFAALILELRQRLGLSQEKLAARLHVSFPTINRWEKGRSRPDAAVRHLIAQFLKGLGPKFADLRTRWEGEQMAGPAATAAAPPPRGRSRRRAGAPEGEMDTRSMEGMLWAAACGIRGEKDAPKFKDYILPLVFLKRLSDVFEDELERLAEKFGSRAKAEALVAGDHSLVRFFIPREATWAVISGRAPAPAAARRVQTVGERITVAVRAVARQNPSLQGVIDTQDFNETRNGEREISDGALSRVIEAFSHPRYRLGLKDVEPDFLGRAYEYLLRKFAEGQGQSAGEFFTPKGVGWLMARLVAPQEGEEVYDPCCGSGGLLIKCQLALRERGPVRRPLRLYGQEYGSSGYALAHMNMVVHDMEGEVLRGDSMVNPKFLANSALRRFDVVVTNPMWNQDNFDPKAYETDPFERFERRGGYAPAGTADWAWLQHIAASLKPQGRAAVVIDTGAASRGSGNQNENKEKAIRRWFLEQDLIEAVILLPDNLFYNTTAAGLVVLLNAAKSGPRQGQVLMLNASGEFLKGRPKNELTEAGAARIAECLREWKACRGLAAVATLAEVAAADYNLSPSRYVAATAAAVADDIQAILDELARLRLQSRILEEELLPRFGALGYSWDGGDGN